MSEPKSGQSVILQPGSRLGPYEVVSLLGAGGMGEVYRARDTRLAREVALKILPNSSGEDTGRFRRFQTEAKAAAALTHPNIVVVHDIGQEAGIPYIVSELVSGGTLTTLIERGQLSIKKLLDLAIPMAEALAAAHANGIVHRDFKPDNILMSGDGAPKIADFGLAKYFEPLPSEGSLGTTLPDDRTREGMIVGTVGYMSPEQAQGKPVDYRSDQFAFGSVLYEMATSERAFRRKSVVDTLAAIINDEPAPIAGANPRIPAPLRWIIERCHAKDPDARYASTADLARELAKLREHLPEADQGHSPAAPAALRRSRAWRILGAAALVATGIVAARLAWKQGPPSVPSFQQLTFRRGNLLRARYTPEGGSIIYSAAWEGASPEVFTARLDGTESRPFGIKNADVLAVSSRGEVAIQLRKADLRNPNAKGTLAVVPLAGGAPRELLENVVAADWTKDGAQLAVVRYEEGEWRLESPAGRLLYKTKTTVDPAMRVSGSGTRIAFIESGAEGEDLRTVDPSGRVMTLAHVGTAEVINGLVWGPEDHEIIFGRFVGSSSGNVSSIDAVDLGGHVRHLYRGAALYLVNDSLPDGRLLIEQAKESADLMFGSSKAEADTNLGWRTSSWLDDLSEDGRTVLFHDHTDMYLRRTDGSPAIRLSPGFSGTLSPDGRFALVGAEREISIIPTGPGQAKTVSTGDLVVDYARMLADGKSIVFGATARDGSNRLYITDTAGTAPRPFSEAEHSSTWAISPDGQEIALAGATDGLKIYGLEGKAPRSVSGFSPDDIIVTWTADRKALLVAEIDVPLRIERFDLATGRKEPWKTLAPSEAAGVYRLGPVAVTRDGKFWAYSASRTSSDELWQVTGLK